MSGAALSPVRGIARRVAAYQLADESVVFFAFYTLLFARHGLSPGRIGTLLAIWSVSSFLFEVPSGALADIVDRRTLLAIAPLLRAAGFVLWVAWPTYAGFALGFVLWSAKSALMSGTLEALVYDELAGLGATSSYGRIIGRARAWSIVGTVVATALAGLVFSLGGYPLVAGVSVAADLVGCVVAATFRRRSRVARVGGDGVLAAYLATLRAGVHEATRRPAVRRLVLLTCLVAGLNIVDEYLPLLARADGLAERLVPYALLPTFVLMAVGGMLAPRRRHTGGGGGLALLLTAAALALVAGGLWRSPAALVLVAAFAGALQFAMVRLEIALQHAIEGEARATVTSVAALGSEVVCLGAFGFYGATASAYGLNLGTAAFALALAPAVLALAWWSRRPARPATDEAGASLGW